MEIVQGFAETGGSALRRSEVVERACEDLKAKIGDAEVTALTTHENDGGVYVIAAVNQAGKKKEGKGGKS